MCAFQILARKQEREEGEEEVEEEEWEWQNGDEEMEHIDFIIHHVEWFATNPSRMNERTNVRAKKSKRQVSARYTY